MAQTQIGYLGNTGPVFEDDATGVAGKKYLLQGQTASNGIVGLYIKQPAYATNLGLNAANYTLGAYADNQRIADLPAFKQPVNGTSFNGFNTDVAAMVTATTIPGATSGGTTSGGSTSGGSTSGGSTSGGSTSGGNNDVSVFSAPTIMEQISTFASNYWWLILIVGGFLLWKPLIAPALGIKTRKRSYR